MLSEQDIKLFERDIKLSDQVFIMLCERDIMSSVRDIKLFGRDIKLSEQINYVVWTRYYVVRTRY